MEKYHTLVWNKKSLQDVLVEDYEDLGQAMIGIKFSIIKIRCAGGKDLSGYCWHIRCTTLKTGHFKLASGTFDTQGNIIIQNLQTFNLTY